MYNFVLSSCVKLKHCNPFDPAYEDEDTVELINESFLTDLPADSADNDEHMNAGDVAIENNNVEKALYEYKTAEMMFPSNLEMKY